MVEPQDFLWRKFNRQRTCAAKFYDSDTDTAKDAVFKATEVVHPCAK